MIFPTDNTRCADVLNIENVKCKHRKYNIFVTFSIPVPLNITHPITPLIEDLVFLRKIEILTNQMSVMQSKG